MQPQRDLIILTKSPQIDVEALEKQVRTITHVLYFVESIDVFCVANEILDINRYKIISVPGLVRSTISDKLKPFVFVFNKN
ncbi:MAG TPA: hypothetical protein VGB84_05030 [Arachidicoccus sp.]